MKIAFRQTKEEYKHLGEWEAQIIGLPQARCYGRSAPEAVGKLVMNLGKEHGCEVEICDPSEMQDQRAPSA